MPLSEASIKHYNAGNTGVSETTTVTAALSGTDQTTAGTDILVAIAWTLANTPTITLPSSFALLGAGPSGDGAGGASFGLYRRKNGPGSESSWAFTFSAGVSACWTVMEIAGLDQLISFDGGSASGTLSLDQITGTAIGELDADVLCIAMHVSCNNSTEVVTWDNHTGGFSELTDQCTSRATARNVSLAVSRMFPGQIGTWGCTATMAATGSSSTWSTGARMVVLHGVYKPAPVYVHTGFEYATLAGIVTGTAGSKLFDAVTNVAAMSIVAGRSPGGSALRINRTAAASLDWSTATLGAGRTDHIVRRWVKVSSATATPGVLGTTTAAGVSAVVSYVTATGKFRLQVGTGTAVDSAQAYTLGTWHRVEYWYSVSGTQYSCQWMVDGIAQTTALSQTGLSATTLALSRLGWSDTATVSCDYDDVADCIARSFDGLTDDVWPIGDGRGILLKADPAGTLTITGTAANFNVFSANGTMAAWNAATALTAISEGPPPTIGAAADGLAQITAAAGDYVDIPMVGYTLQGLELINGVSLVACGWAASTLAATIGLRGRRPAVGDSVLLTTGDPNFDNSTTAPAWIRQRWDPTGNAWTQAQLDGAELLVGFSDDATPDIGIHWIALEVDIRADQPHGVFGTTGTVMLDAEVDPVSGGILTLTATTPPGQGASVTYELSGTPITFTVPANSTWLEPIGAADATVVNRISLYPDPEPA